MMIFLQMIATVPPASAATIDEKARSQVSARLTAAEKSATAPPVVAVQEPEPINRILSLVGGSGGWSATVEIAGGKVLVINPGEPLENGWRVSSIDAMGVSIRRKGKLKRYEFGQVYGNTGGANGLPALPALPAVR